MVQILSHFFWKRDTYISFKSCKTTTCDSLIKLYNTFINLKVFESTSEINFKEKDVDLKSTDLSTTYLCMSYVFWGESILIVPSLLTKLKELITIFLIFIKF